MQYGTVSAQGRQNEMNFKLHEAKNYASSAKCCRFRWTAAKRIYFTRNPIVALPLVDKHGAVKKRTS